jgi:hypothetical protein
MAKIVRMTYARLSKQRVVGEYGEFNVNELFVEAEPESRKTR